MPSKTKLKIPPKPSGYKPLTCGEQVESQGVKRLGIAPKHFSTGRSSALKSLSLTKKEKQFIEFSPVNPSTGIIQYSLCLTVLGLLGFLWWALAILKTGIDGNGFFPPMIFTALSFLIPGSILMFGTVFWSFKGSIDDAKTNLPLRFHAQRQQVSFSYARSNKTPMPRPELFSSDKKGVCFLGIIFTGGFQISYIENLFFSNSSMDSSELIIEIISSLVLVALFCYCLYVVLHPWWVYFKHQKGYQQTIELVTVPWESVFIEYQSAHIVSPSANTTYQNLVFTVPDPVYQGEYIYTSLQVSSRPQALGVYEFLRHYMDTNSDEQGEMPEFVKQAKMVNPKYTRKAYKALLQKKLQENPATYLFWRLFYMLTLKYWAHYYLEYHLDIAPALTKLNQELAKLYEQGYQWRDEEVQSFLAKHRVSV